VQKCFEDSWEVQGDYESGNKFLKTDADWAVHNNLKYHPSVAINNMTYRGDVNGQDLAMAICAAYREKPDECDLSWKIRTYQTGLLEKSAGLPSETDDFYNVASMYLNETELAKNQVKKEDRAQWY